MSVELDNVSAGYGGLTAVRGVTLAVERGELLALLGPSGSGKTTLLFVLAGFQAADSGTVRLDGCDVRGISPRSRSIGMVFQDHALWPHLTVAGHLDFVLRARGVPRGERKDRIAEILGIVELAPVARKVPSTVSGGEAQRVALARALVARPKILLLDEPLGALDRRLREKMLRLIRQVHDRFGTTTIYVTHDYDEALYLAHRVAVMDAGEIQQVGWPEEVYNRPVNARVAEITGMVSLVGGKRSGERVVLPWGSFRAGFAEPAGERVVVALRPEQANVCKEGEGLARSVRFRSGRWEVDVEIAGVRVTGSSREIVAPGDRVSLSLAEPVWAFAGKDEEAGGKEQPAQA